MLITPKHVIFRRSLTSLLNSQIRLQSNQSATKNDVNPSEEQSSKDDEKDWFNVSVGSSIDERVVPKPVSYLPDHLPQTRARQRQKPWWKFRYFVEINTLPAEQKEYTEQPEYPPIYDSSNEGIKKQIRTEWYDAIKRLPSAQQKIYEITKHYGHLSYMLEPVMKAYNVLPIQQFITKTHLIHQLPESYLQNLPTVDEDLKQHILKLISSRLFNMKTRESSFDFKKNSIPQMGFSSNENKIQSYKEDDILSDLTQLIRSHQKVEENSDIHFDYYPFVGTSWWVRDFPVPFKKSKWFKNDHLNQMFTYKGNHSLHMRSKYPLPSLVQMDDDLCTKSEIPKWNHNLLNLGVHIRRHNIISLPGFWPGQSSQFDFPYLLGLSREELRNRKENGFQDCNDDQEVLDGMAIMASFGWLTSLAGNLGFTFYDALTYPLVTNVIITDGQHWSFYVYQLNNHRFHEDFEETSVCNLCWSSGEMKLFNQTDGLLTDVNETVLSYLIKFLTMQPQTNLDYELRPYLSEDNRSDDDKAELNYSLRRKFANQVGTYIGPRKKTNLWEQIYKNHKDAPADVKRLRPKIEMKYPPFFK